MTNIQTNEQTNKQTNKQSNKQTNKQSNQIAISRFANVSSIQLSDDPTWIIDPIDGTCNFVHRIPHTCISLALLIKKRTRVAVVFNPLTNELYHAVEGSGAFLNGQRISVSRARRLSDAIVVMDVWASNNPKKAECTLSNVKELVSRIRVSFFDNSAETKNKTFESIN